VLEPLRDPLILWALSSLLVLVVLVAAIGSLHYRRRRNEEKLVHRLLRSLWIWDHRTLRGDLHQKGPVAALESVKGIQVSLKSYLQRLPNGSKGTQPVREMHKACLGFLTRIGSLPAAGETGLQPGKWVAGGTYQEVLEDALRKLRSSLGVGLDQLQEAYSAEKLPLPEIEEVKQ